MLTIVQRGGATHEKPPEVVRGPACRLPWAWDGLSFAVAFQDATRDASRDLVWGAAPSSVTGLAWARDDRGNPVASLADDCFISYPYNPAHNSPSSAITAHVRLKRSVTREPGSQWSGVIAKRYNASAPPWNSWAIQGSVDNTSLLGHIAVGTGGAYQEFESTYVLPTTEWINAVMRWRSGSAPRLDMFGDRGDLRASQVFGSTTTGTIAYSTGQPITINATEVDNVNYIADYSQVMLWSRYLTDTELQALFADPYGWYSPRRATVFTSSPYPFVFGGGEMKFGTGAGGLR
jgi:hypothetical protein